MGFGERIAQADTVVIAVNERIWNVAPLVGRIFVEKYGYETHVRPQVMRRMNTLGVVTSKFIRFTPDFFVLDQQRPESIYLLEYKTTQTPLFSTSRIREMQYNTKLSTLRWQDIGQMEADAYDAYMKLHTLGARIVILNYCAYNERLLLCDYIERIQILHRDKVTGPTTTGSRTPFVNFDCTGLRTLETFILEEHNIVIDSNTYQSVLYDLSVQLPVKHHEKSPHHPSNRRR